MISITWPCHMTSKMASNPNIALLIVCTLFVLQQPGANAIFQAVVHKSIGRPWPLPQTIITTGKVHSLDAVNFQFRVVGSDCDIVRAAIDRYSQLIFSIHGVDATLRFHPMAMGRGNDGQVLKQLDVNIKEECDGIYPSLEMNESCMFINVFGFASVKIDRARCRWYYWSSSFYIEKYWRKIVPKKIVQNQT